MGADEKSTLPTVGVASHTVRASLVHQGGDLGLHLLWRLVKARGIEKLA